MKLSGSMRQAWIESIYEFVWIVIAVMALLCAILGALSQEAYAARNLIDCPEYEACAAQSAEPKEQINISESVPPILSRRQSSEVLTQGAKFESESEQYIGGTDDFNIKDEVIEEDDLSNSIN